MLVERHQKCGSVLNKETAVGRLCRSIATLAEVSRSKADLGTGHALLASTSYTQSKGDSVQESIYRLESLRLNHLYCLVFYFTEMFKIYLHFWLQPTDFQQIHEWKEKISACCTNSPALSAEIRDM